jgi:hypothetical protein
MCRDLMITGLFLLFMTLTLLPTPSIGAERIWDNDLKRFLTDQEMMMAEVYLQEEDGVKIMFAKNSSRSILIRNPSSKNVSAGNFLKNHLKSTSENQELRLTAMRSYKTQSANINT